MQMNRSIDLSPAQADHTAPGVACRISREPVVAVGARRWDAMGPHSVREQLAAEVPVAMQYNARPHAVMLASPADLDDFAYGFAVTERIVGSVTELTLVD